MTVRVRAGEVFMRGFGVVFSLDLVECVGRARGRDGVGVCNG